ncbi:hypothetical protein [Azospirillum sp. BE72]|uniref:hypothetical protein n=1 Tax=Azospirillum sp. BE72 TaxID=2817776 RepID=UPI00285D3455|nr:hypothetical protein [Azospirillum sp. BE72]MDR6775537.1 hypothetical protein [Azospirillum sp. BE72]
MGQLLFFLFLLFGVPLGISLLRTKFRHDDGMRVMQKELEGRSNYKTWITTDIRYMPSIILDDNAREIVLVWLTRVRKIPFSSVTMYKMGRTTAQEYDGNRRITLYTTDSDNPAEHMFLSPNSADDMMALLNLRLVGIGPSTQEAEGVEHVSVG